jgi:hypothetical protein
MRRVAGGLRLVTALGRIPGSRHRWCRRLLTDHLELVAELSDLFGLHGAEMIAPAVADVARYRRNLIVIELIAERGHHPAAHYDLGTDIIRQLKEWVVPKGWTDPTESLLAVTDKTAILHKYLFAVRLRLALGGSWRKFESANQQYARYDDCNRRAYRTISQGLNPLCSHYAHAQHVSASLVRGLIRGGCGRLEQFAAALLISKQNPTTVVSFLPNAVHSMSSLPAKFEKDGQEPTKFAARKFRDRDH